MSRVHRRTRGGVNFGLILLAGQIFQIGTNNIPPVTLCTIIINVLIYLRLIPSIPTVHGACTSNNLVLGQKQWKRLIFSSFYHLDDMHLYFNMISFLWKGIQLEKKMKSRKFFFLIVLFCILSQSVMIGINQILAEAFSNEAYLYSCAAGFSAVCFAVKVVSTVNSNSNESIMGLPFIVPARYACWVELVLIQILVPNASFTGHLAGIIVGLMYTHGPLSKVVDFMDNICSGILSFGSTSRSYNYQSGQTGPHTERRRTTTPNDDEDDDEQLQRAIQESLRFDSFQAQQRARTPPTYGWSPDVTSPRPHIPRTSTQRTNQSDRSTYEHIYPDLSQTERDHTTPPYPVSDDYYPPPSYKHDSRLPSAPPLSDETAPYPVDDFTPRQTKPSNLPNTKHSTSDPETIRNARLRKFDNRK